MPAKVILKVVQGASPGQTILFDERTTCLIGRGEDCQLHLPNDDDHRLVSRHHCLLDINPPDLRVRDFGSRNGTYVNGLKIGQRAPHLSASEGSGLFFPEHDLKNGDEIKLGQTILAVSIVPTAVCTRCGAAIAENQLAATEIAPGKYECATCSQSTETHMPSVAGGKACARCGRGVAEEPGANRPGDFVCGACQGDPLGLVKRLLEQANAGHHSLVSIQGYEIVRELGHGGMGAVYLARNTESREQVALKIMLPRVAADETARRMFLRETENTKVLKHPNVVQLLDAGCSDGTFFLTLEYCAGGTVAELMSQRGGPLTVDESLPMILQALSGLEYAHQAEMPEVKKSDGTFGPGRGLVHRDLKPSNIFLCGSGKSQVAKIGDYGLAKAFDVAGLSGYTRTGTIAGTPFFMPRQQLINFKYAKPEVDVWSMAATLYFMLTNATPRDFPRDQDWCRIVLETAAVPIRRRNSAVPARLAEAIDQALIDKPGIPFKTASDLKRALESV